MNTAPPQLVKSDEGIWLMFDQGHYVRPATAEEITLWQRLVAIVDALDAHDAEWAHRHISKRSNVPESLRQAIDNAR